MNKLTAICITLSIVALMGCQKSPEEVAAIKKQMDEPKITVVGNFNGCEVSYVDRYYANESFYMAKCPGLATTQTTHFETREGKVAKKNTKTTITEMAEIDKKIDEIQKELNTARLQKSGLAKLNEAEKEAIFNE